MVAENDDCQMIWLKEVRAVHGERMNKTSRPDAEHIPISASASRFQHIVVCFHVTGSSISNGPIRARSHYSSVQAASTAVTVVFKEMENSHKVNG